MRNVFNRNFSNGLKPIALRYAENAPHCGKRMRKRDVATSLYSHFNIGQKLQFSGQRWTFYMRIQDSRTKMTEPNYRE